MIGKVAGGWGGGLARRRKRERNAARVMAAEMRKKAILVRISWSPSRLVLEDLVGCRRLHKVELRIELQGAVQVIPCAICIAGCLRDHSGVINNPGVHGAEPHGLFDRRLGLVEFAGFQGRPCQGIRAIYVFAGMVLPSRALVRLFRLQIVVCVKQRYLSVVEGPVYFG